MLSAAPVLFAVPAVASAEVYVVNTTADGFPQTCPTVCTLREAVALAGPTDTITVPEGRYLLSQGELRLDGDTINGAGARTTIIDGGGNSRVISAQTNGETNPTISGVTISGGNGSSEQNSGQGGGIRVDFGLLVLTNSHVYANTAVTGGGIHLASGANLLMVGSTVAANVATTTDGAGQGGGIYSANEGQIFAVANSTITGNAARGSIPGEAVGGGIYAGGGTNVTLSSATVAGNEAPVGNGAGVYLFFASGQFANTLLADNAGGACGGEQPEIQPASHHNLVTDNSCGLTGPGNLQGVAAQLAGLANNGGPTDTRALAPTSLAINAGSECPTTDQRGVPRPANACDIGAFEYVPPPPQPGPPPPPPADDDLPAPVIRKSVNLVPKSGTVRIKLPGRRRYRKLTKGEQIPVGTTVDTLKGRVTLTAASNKSGGTATSDFYKGIFKVSQTKGKRPITVLTLTEKLSCPKAGSAVASATKKRKRRLWGDGSGRFRTKGRHSAATVVGTKWLVEDRCKSTLTRVVRGKVKVRDFVKKKTITLRRGKRYVAKARP